MTLTAGREGEQGAELAGGRRVAVDSLAISGRLVPNTELLIEAGLEIQASTGIPQVDRRGRLASPGWFVAGNAIGGFHGGQSSFFHGLRVAKNVAQYLHERASTH